MQGLIEHHEVGGEKEGNVEEKAGKPAGIDGDHEDGKQGERVADLIEEFVLFEVVAVFGAFEDAGEEEDVDAFEGVVGGTNGGAGEPKQRRTEVRGNGCGKVTDEQVEEDALGEENVGEEECQVGLIDTDGYDYQAQLAGGGESNDFFDIVLSECADCCEQCGDGSQAQGK